MSEEHHVWGEHPCLACGAPVLDWGEARMCQDCRYESKCDSDVLYFNWETRYVLPRPRGEELRKGDAVGGELGMDTVFGRAWRKVVAPERGRQS